MINVGTVTRKIKVRSFFTNNDTIRCPDKYAYLSVTSGIFALIFEKHILVSNVKK